MEKTAEEILNKKRTLIHYPTKELIIEAMEEYAAIKIAEQYTRIAELEDALADEKTAFEAGKAAGLDWWTFEEWKEHESTPLPPGSKQH